MTCATRESSRAKCQDHQKIRGAPESLTRFGEVEACFCLRPKHLVTSRLQLLSIDFELFFGVVRTQTLFFRECEKYDELQRGGARKCCSVLFHLKLSTFSSTQHGLEQSRSPVFAATGTPTMLTASLSIDSPASVEFSLKYMQLQNRLKSMQHNLPLPGPIPRLGISTPVSEHTWILGLCCHISTAHQRGVQTHSMAQAMRIDDGVGGGSRACSSVGTVPRSSTAPLY